MPTNTYVTQAMIDEIDAFSSHEQDEKMAIALANLTIEQARLLAPKITGIHSSFPLAEKEAAMLTFIGELLIEYAKTQEG